MMQKRVMRLTLIITLLGAFFFALPAMAQEDGDLGVIRVGTNAEYPPFERVDENDDIVGFDIDLFNAIAADAGFEVEFVNTRWDGIFVALSQGEFDAVISAATITEEREEIIDFSEPYFNAGQTIATTSALADSISSLEDLAGLRIGVQLGTTGDEYASQVDGAEVVRFDEVTLAFQALGEGDIDAIINDGPTSADIIANNPELNAVIVGEPLTDEFYGIAINPERTDLLDAVNLSLANIIASGEYAEIYREWFQQDPPEMFLPAEDTADGGEVTMMTLEDVDRSDPASVAMGFVHLLLSDLESASTLVCGDAPEDTLPSAAEVEELAGIVFDFSAMSFEVEEDGDTATATATGEVTLTAGEETVTGPANEMFSEPLNMVRVDGEWFFCPTEDETTD